ncbi:hypothetical protein [Nocardioides perillae]|uniref:Putative membrane protein n=1 Tax=Nocardioides perillae TaxID=1119534 RepID=A0A7Y9RVM7_9ACTN|nr:putative membrane protein [Nocardioides perillae]
MTAARSRRVRRTTTLALAAGALTLMSSSTVPGALAAGAGSAEGGSTGAVDVVNTETVQAFLDPDGTVSSSRVYEQLVLSGTGRASVENPVSTEGLRNLDGFSGWSVQDGAQRLDLEVDGVERLRSVSDFDGDLPVTVEVEYRLDGERVEPDDVVGASGLLEVTYRVRNGTGREQEVEVPDGRGGTTTQTVEVAVPIVASLEATLPAGFAEVVSEGAQIAGDGRGGMLVKHTLTLFPPVGAPEAEVTWSAQVTDAVVPGAKITALPINPFANPTLKKASDSYTAGAETGATLAAGATEIDTNLLKLRDGAGELLAGLIQLSDGADQLSAGLVDSAAPGSRKLADGAAELSAGLQGRALPGAGKLADGAQQLFAGLFEDAAPGARKIAAGARELAAGLGDLDAGAGKLQAGLGTLEAGTGSAAEGGRKLEAGLQQISGGLGQLASAEAGLPAAEAGITQLKAGVDQLLAGFGSTSQADTLLNGLARLSGGLTELKNGAGTLTGGLQQLRGGSTSGLGLAKGGVDQVQSGLAAAASSTTLPNLIKAVKNAAALPDCGATCNATLLAIVTNFETYAAGSANSLTTAATVLGQVSAGLGQAIGGLDTQLIPGGQKLAGGLTTAETGAGAALAGATKLQAGTQQVAAGLAQLQGAMAKAVAGVLQLSGGSSAALTGASDLAAGLERLDAGAGQLAAGSGDLADGTGKAAAGGDALAAGTGTLAEGLDGAADGSGLLADGARTLEEGLADAADGSGLLADGADELADGLGTAADGSGRLADGLEKAAAGAPALQDGAQRLSTEGMSKLVAAGEDTASDYGVLAATIAASAERAETETMAYGAPEGAQGLTAYSLELVADTGDDERTAMRGLGAALVLALALGSLALRRRFLQV